MKKYYAFYIWPYSNEARREEFDSAEQVEAFYKRAMGATSASDCGESDYRNLVVIWGERVAFKAVEVVTEWKVR